MRTTQFDAKAGAQFTTEITDFNHSNRILGDGYFVIVNPNSKHVSFSKSYHDICFGDIVSDIIPNYTNQDYANDYGNKLTGVGKTVKEYMQQNCRMNIV
jgi:hypothetical protein